MLARGVPKEDMAAFDWNNGQPSEIGKSLIKTQTAPRKPGPQITYSKKQKLSTGNAFAGAGGQIKPERQPPAVYKKNGLVTPDNYGFSIPSRAQAQADTDKRHALVKGGI